VFTKKRVDESTGVIDMFSNSAPDQNIGFRPVWSGHQVAPASTPSPASHHPGMREEFFNG
jgi:hypothetical protein